MTEPLSHEISNAYLLRRVMETTMQPGESDIDITTRCAVIMAMFQALAPVNAMQASIACHCISLEFTLATAMREAGQPGLEEKPLAKARAYAMSTSRAWHQWVTKYQKTQALDATRVAADAKAAAAAATTIAAEAAATTIVAEAAATKIAAEAAATKIAAATAASAATANLAALPRNAIRAAPARPTVSAAKTLLAASSSHEAMFAAEITAASRAASLPGKSGIPGK